jgi:hypothetical protein
MQERAFGGLKPSVLKHLEQAYGDVSNHVNLPP